MESLDSDSRYAAAFVAPPASISSMNRFTHIGAAASPMDTLQLSVSFPSQLAVKHRGPYAGSAAVHRPVASQVGEPTRIALITRRASDANHRPSQVAAVATRAPLASPGPRPASACPKPQASGPGLLPHHGFGDIPDTALSLIVSFQGGRWVAGVGSWVCRRWLTVISDDVELRAQRFEFYCPLEQSPLSMFAATAPSDRGGGILHYLCGVRPRQTRASLHLIDVTPTVAGVRIANVPETGSSSSLTVLRRQQMNSYEVLLRNACERCDRILAPDRSSVAPVVGVSTDSVPFAWIGFDFGSLRVSPTHYTIAVAGGSHEPVPRDWELQGSQGNLSDWGACDWHVLDARHVGDAPVFGRFQTECTFPVVANVFSHECRTVDADTPSPRNQRERHPATSPSATAFRFRRLRIVQTSRNSHWGHQLHLSAVEFFGRLTFANS